MDIKTKPHITVRKKAPAPQQTPFVASEKEPNVAPVAPDTLRPGDAKELLAWDAPEFQQQPKNQNWYIGLGLVIAVAVTISVFAKSLITAATFFMLGIIVVIYAQKEPNKARFVITDLGVEYNGKYYPYTRIKNFWLLYNPPYISTLNFQLKKGLFDLKIELGNQDPQKVRTVLQKYTKEDRERQEDLSDALARRLKF